MVLGPDNETRAYWAQCAVEAFQEACATDDCDVIADLLCDIMHLCERQSDKFGTWKEALRRAQSNYEAEKQEESAHAL
jgi:hypothetical protein